MLGEDRHELGSKDMEGGHWAVVYGYSSGHIHVADSSVKRAVLCRHATQRFLQRWDRWAMVVECRRALMRQTR
jgi:hypothetical protein